MIMWADSEAGSWNEAYPIGNGKLGAMIGGGVNTETIWLNEDSIWSGNQRDRINPDALSSVIKIRDLLHKGKIEEAQELAIVGLSGIPQSQRAYQTAGELYIYWNKSGEASDYKRELNLENAIVHTTYIHNKTRYDEEAFASIDNNVIAIRLYATGTDTINFRCRFGRSRNCIDSVFRLTKDNIIGFDSNNGNGGISYHCAAGAIGDGNICVKGEQLVVQEATKVTIYISINSKYRVNDTKEACITNIQKAYEIGYEQLKKDNIKNYSEIFGRTRLSLGGKKMGCIPTARRLENVRKGIKDNGLIELYFDYGKYLLISSSNKDSLPANLQGIWNKEMMPPWESKFTININLQMNYWMADSCRLDDCYMPFFTLLRRVNNNGKITARKMYSCRGSVAHHNTDIYGDTAPQDHYIPASYWVMGQAWLALHIMQHYEYTQDIQFLRDYYDVLEDNVLFFIDFLIENKKGELVTSPSVSPENMYITEKGEHVCMCEGPTMDCEILRALIRDYLHAGTILEIQNDIQDGAHMIARKLPEYRIGRFGQLQEWNEDYDEVEPGHRHISHLFGVYPDCQFTWEETPELMVAAKKSLERRLEFGGGHTGWSKAWIIALWARFREGNLVYKNIMELFMNSTMPNLMDSHPMKGGDIFQIDGNLGTCAAIIEMLIQCHNDRVILLPALPDEIPNGALYGVRIRGNAICDFEWEDLRLKRVVISAYSDIKKKFVLDGTEIIIELAKGQKYEYLVRR